SVVEDADKAFVQHVISERLGRAMTRDQPIGIECDRRSAFVDDTVMQGEQILVVDLDGTAELETLAIVPDKRHRLTNPQLAGALRAPLGVGIRKLEVCAGAGNPAELRIERIGRTGW